jgi:uncharacterized protein (TIGR02594 family)
MLKYTLPLALFIGFAFIPSTAIQASFAKDLIVLMEKDLGDRRPKGCPSKWCACYMNTILEKAGFTSSGSNRARDFAAYGKKAKPTAIGSIMVMRHHVGVVAGQCPDGRIKLISGNHSRKVAIGCYSAKKAIAWRVPARS